MPNEPLSPNALAALKVRDIAFNAEALRAYFFKTAMDVAEQMKLDQVERPDIAIMNGALEFSAQLWMWLSLQHGVPKQKARQTAEKIFRTFLINHMNSKPEQLPEEERSS